jgi:MFS family permease
MPSCWFVRDTPHRLFYPFSVLYFHEVAGLSFPLIGLGLTVATGVSLATVPLQGVLVDRLGTRTMVIAAMLLRAVGFLAYLFVHSFLAFILLAGVVAIGNNSPAGDALVAEIAAPEDRDRWFGLIRVLVNAGHGAGGLLGGLAAATLGIAGYQGIVVLNALSFVVAAGMLTQLRMPRSRKSSRTVARLATQDAGGRATGGERGAVAGKAAGYGAVLRDRPFLGLVRASTLLWMSICSSRQQGHFCPAAHWPGRS